MTPRRAMDLADVSPEMRDVILALDRAMEPVLAYEALLAREVLADPAAPEWKRELAREALRSVKTSRRERRRRGRRWASQGTASAGPGVTAEPRTRKDPQRLIIGSKGKAKAPGDER